MTTIKDALRDFNPWWTGPYHLDFKHRDIYTHLQKFLPLPQMLAFTGLRRVGKTTLLLKLAADKITQGLDPKHILYFSFDEFKTTNLRTVLQEYESLTENDLKEGQYLLLLDEIQKLAAWEEQLKTLYDLYGKRVKIIISGSESLFIKKKSKETLAGRLFEFDITPLTFTEFLTFKDTTFSHPQLHEKELLKLFHEFTFTLGFPELVGIKDKEIIKKYVDEGIVKKAVYQDISRLFDIKDITVIESLLTILMEDPGQLLELTELAKVLHITRQTLATYLSYLEAAFLLRKIYNFSRNKRKSERKLKKYYPTIISPHLLFKDDLISQSKVFEWLIVTQAQAEFFWRDPYKHEVDVVLASNNTLLPLEIKYGKIDVHGLLAFMNTFHVNKGIVVSYQTTEKRTYATKTITILPAYRYLLTPTSTSFKENI